MTKSPNGSAPSNRVGLPIAVDTMGGDKGLDVQVEGAVEAYRSFGLRSILVGPEDVLKSKLDSLGAGSFPLQVFHAPEVIEMGESPAKAVRKKKRSSLCMSFQLVQLGQASAMISAGNSGAMMAAGRMICGLMPGIDRPAIATPIPVAGGGHANIVLDVGANVGCDAQNLVQFAVMGGIYFSSLFSVEKPKIALLANGTEASKGTDVIRSAAIMLSKMPQLNYVGYVEGRDVGTRASDVIVCDGFVGNVLLKAMEGCVRLIAEELISTGKKGLFRRIGLGLSRGTFKEVFLDRFDYASHGGAPLLGLNKLGLVLHGSSDQKAVKNALRATDTFVRTKMTERIGSALAQLEESEATLSGGIPLGVFGGDPVKGEAESDDVIEVESKEERTK